MDKSKRKVVIAGNWKMNMTPDQTEAFIKELAPLTKGKDNSVTVLCVPFVDIATAVKAAKGTNIHVGAQNVHFAEKGAYTGEDQVNIVLYNKFKCLFPEIRVEFSLRGRVEAKDPIRHLNTVMIHHHVIPDLVSEIFRHSHFTDRLWPADNDQVCHTYSPSLNCKDLLPLLY